MADLNRTIDRSIRISRSVSDVLQRRLRAAGERYTGRVRTAQANISPRTPRPRRRSSSARQWCEYGIDAAQRSVLFWDTLRQRGNQWIEHEAAGKPPVLDYRYELIADARGRTSGPSNYALVRIMPPRGVEVDDAKRPFVIVDPRAGPRPRHRRIQGGLRGRRRAARGPRRCTSSSSSRSPMPGQTLADITDAEAEFIRIVAERHPQSQKPVIIGNCQGGWAVMMLAAARPDIAGPLVINGAPMSYWSGNDGESPMRYAGGLLGGTWLSLLAADLGAGKFDGAHLVLNFENLNPANTLWEKWYHLYANIDTEPERFLEFERWWGGFYLFNEEEIRWIVNNLFVGNKLASGEARLGPGPLLRSRSRSSSPSSSSRRWATTSRRRSRRSTGSPTSTARREEIKANGQTIVGLLHEDIGHLGIFVSGQVAKKEHAQIVEVLKYIQQLPPGLYGMNIEEHAQSGRRGQVRRDAVRAQGRGPAHAAEIRPRRREAVRGGGRAVRASRARLLAARAAVRARRDRPNGSPRRCATSIRCACSTGRCRTRTRGCGRCRVRGREHARPAPAARREQRQRQARDARVRTHQRVARPVSRPARRERRKPRSSRCTAT